jgi:hypothetical protein
MARFYDSIYYPLTTTLDGFEIFTIYKNNVTNTTTIQAVWDAVSISLDDVSDVSVLGATDGQVLMYNDTSGDWESVSGAFLPSGATEGQIAVYVSSVWVAQDPPTGGGGGYTWEVQVTTVGNEGITADVNTKYMVDTTLSTANIILILPIGAEIGDIVGITDMRNNFSIGGTKNVITGMVLFEGISQTVEFDLTNSSTELVYTGVTYGWKAVLIQQGV